MADIFADIMNAQFLGVPTIFIIGALIFFIIIVLRLKPKQKEFKRISLEKEIRKDMDMNYARSGIKINKPIRIGGFVNAGYAVGFYNDTWDLNAPLRARLQWKEKVKAQVQAKAEPKMIEMVVFKCCFNDPVRKVMGIMFGFKTYYMTLPSQYYKVNAKEIILHPGLNKTDFFNVVVCTKSAREYVENIAFKVNRKNELDEFANTVPKQNYLELSTASMAAKAREKANIEKEKYKGQIESAEEA